MSKISGVPFVRVANFEEAAERAGHGWWFDERGCENGGLHVYCPCGCGGLIAMRFYAFGSSSGWSNTGTLEKPNTQPSIGFNAARQDGVEADGYHWHGYLENGVFNSVYRE